MDALSLLPPEHEYRQMYAFAMMVADAAFIPAAARGKVASVFYLIATGNSMGAKWEHSLRSCYMTPDSRIGFQWDFIAACLMSKGFKIEWPENTKQKVRCKITRPPANGEPGQSHEEEFGTDAANTIQVWVNEKPGRPGHFEPLSKKFNYQSYAKNMFMARAGMNCARAIAPDVMGGIYTQDEIEGLPPDIEMQGFVDDAPTGQTFDVGESDAPKEAASGAQSTAAPTAEAAPATVTRRGRKPMVPDPPKTSATPAVQMGPAATTATAAPAAATAAPATTAAPAPAAQATEAAPVEAAKPGKEAMLAMKKRVDPLVAKLIEAGIPEKTTDGSPHAMGLLQGFIRGYLGIAKIPADLKPWEDTIEHLEFAVANRQRELIADAGTLGYNMKNGSPLDHKLGEWKWAGDAAESARKFAREFYPGKEAALITWLENFKANEILITPQDVMSFFDAASLVDGSTSSKADAITLLELAMLPICKENNEGVSKLVANLESMGKKGISEMTVSDLHSYINDLKASIDRIAAADKEALAAGAPAGDDTASLFEEA